MKSKTLPGSISWVQMRSGRNRRTGAGAAVEVDVAVEQLFAGQCDVVGDADVADVADVAAGSGVADGLHHRLRGADGLNDRVRAEAVGEVLDLGDAVVAAFGDDVGGPELAVISHRNRVMPSSRFTTSSPSSSVRRDTVSRCATRS